MVEVKTLANEIGGDNTTKFIKEDLRLTREDVILSRKRCQPQMQKILALLFWWQSR